MRPQSPKLLSRSIVGLTLVALMSVSSTIAQETRQIELNQVPPQGKAVQEFVPAGWTVETKVDGDLNGDRIPDTVLKVIEAVPPETNEEASGERTRALIVLLKQSSGQWQRLALTDRLLLCSICGGTFSSPNGENIKVTIEDGVILVQQYRGSRNAIETLHRFWLDKPSNRIVRIGEDIRRYDRANGDETRESSNYLTGLKIVEQYRGNRQRNGLELVSSKRYRIPKTKLLIESVDIKAIGF